MLTVIVEILIKQRSGDGWIVKLSCGHTEWLSNIDKQFINCEQCMRQIPEEIPAPLP